jgi:hypothetical protein
MAGLEMPRLRNSPPDRINPIAARKKDHGGRSRFLFQLPPAPGDPAKAILLNRLAGLAVEKKVIFSYKGRRTGEASQVDDTFDFPPVLAIYQTHQNP